jgi:hypothetical protein
MAGQGLTLLQAHRIANDSPADMSADMIGEICQFLSTLLVLQDASDMSQEDKQKLLQKLTQWSRTWRGQFAGETSLRCRDILTNNRYAFLSLSVQI